MKAIIFGASGQDGHYLMELCKLRHIEPIGVSRSGNGIKGDVSIYREVEHLVSKHKPAYVFHVAAKSTTRHEALFENHETISTGTLNILEAVNKHCPESKVFLTGSGVQFVNMGLPISETNAFEASSPYSVARIQSVYAGRYYRTLGLKVYIGYLFHHESPLRKPNHVSQIIALAAQRIAKGSNEIIELGDISVEKEWAFAGDIAKGIFTLIEQDRIFEATIGTGEVFSIENWLEQCFRLIGRDWHNHVKLREDFFSEYKRLYSNPRIINELGWFPSVKLPELAAMMVTIS